MPLNARVRRYVPSVSRLTYYPSVKVLLDLFDVLPRMMFKEFRRLPPNHLRCRVGVRNRIFANQAHFLLHGRDQWLNAFDQGWCHLDSDIVEIGVGCGRGAFHLRDASFHGRTYTGSYLGIDIDDELLAWCRDNFDGRFEFVHSSHESVSYVNERSSGDYYRIPRDDSTVDYIYGGSVFTHLLEDTIENYLTECARVLRPDRVMAMSCFFVDLPQGTLGDRHTFQHRVGDAHVESLAQPTAAVAYDTGYLFDLAKRCGFSEASSLHDPADAQHLLVCRT